MKILQRPGWLIIALALAGTGRLEAQPVAGAPPSLIAQNSGWPYTRTGFAAGVDKISDQVAVYPGSRYGLVHGMRVELDDQDPLHSEAVVKDGEIYVPMSFAGYLKLDQATPEEPAPDFYRDRWVYRVPRPPFTPPADARTIQVNGKPYICLADAGNALHLHVYTDESGILCIGDRPDFGYTTHELNLRDDTITAFDMPEKYADTKILLKYVPQVPALVPAPKTPAIPKTAYNFGGFNFRMLAGKMPPPGVYPRLLFGPEDLPIIQQRVKNTLAMQMALAEMDALFAQSWWDQHTPDGKMFLKLANGEPTDYTSEGHGAGIYSSNVNYVTNCLTSMALFSLLSGDEAHGQMAANAIYNYYKTLEPRLDQVIAASENEIAFAPEYAPYPAKKWAGIDQLVSGMDLGLALDFAGKWMTPAQKELMRRVIVKATYGRRAAPGAGLSHLLALAAIQGLPGFDAEGFAADTEQVRSFLDWDIDEHGLLTAEGKAAGNLQFQVLAMIVLAREGDNMWGHPHWRNFLNGVPEPAKGVKAGSDPTEGGPYDTQTILEYRAFYPESSTANAILRQRFPNFDPATLDLTLFTAQLANETAAHMRQLKLRLPGLSYPGYVPSVLYDTDWTVQSRGE